MCIGANRGLFRCENGGIGGENGSDLDGGWIVRAELRILGAWERFRRAGRSERLHKITYYVKLTYIYGKSN